MPVIDIYPTDHTVASRQYSTSSLVNVFYTNRNIYCIGNWTVDVVYNFVTQMTELVEVNSFSIQKKSSCQMGQLSLTPKLKLKHLGVFKFKPKID